MLLTAKGSGADFEKIPPATHVATCYAIADVGTQKVNFQGDIKFKRKLIFIWETPNARMEDGRPFAVSKMYTASLYPGSNLRADLESWRGAPFAPEEEEGFDPVHFLMKPCFVGVVHETKNGKTYANVSSVLALPAGVPAPAACINPPVYFSLDSYNQQSFDALPNWIKEKIKASPEYRALLGGLPVGESAGVPTSMHTTKPSMQTGTSPMADHGVTSTEAPPAFPPDMPEDDIPF